MAWWKAVATIVVVMSGLAEMPAARAAPTATTTPAPTEIRKGKWDTLPDGVCSVFVAPDQRRWFIKISAEQTVDVEKIKACIAAEWKNNSPMLVDCWPMLFEKSGAVWLVTRDRRTLLRYDGTAWIEKTAQCPPEVMGGFTGTCPGHGLTHYRVHNLEAAGACLFVESTGISAYDGTKWTFQPFTTGPKTAYTDPLSLLAEPDGQGAVAVEYWHKAIWRYRDGKWKRVPLPWTGKDTFDGAAIGPDGTLWVSAAATPNHRSIIEIPLDGKKPTTSATQPVASPVMIGGIDVNKYSATVSQDELGNVNVFVWNIPEDLAKERSGTYVLSPNGNARFLPGVNAAESGTHEHLLADAGKSLWISATQGGPEQSAKRVDMSAPPFLQSRMPINFRFVQAVAADGTVYIAINDPLDAFRRGPLMLTMVAYKPTEADDRPFAQPQAFETVGPSAVAAGDGAVWAIIPDKGLCRFDGREWKSFKSPLDAWTTLIPGAGSSMLWWFRGKDKDHPETFGVIQGNDRVEATDLWTLVKEHPEPCAIAVRGLDDPQLWMPTQDRMLFPPRGPTSDGGWCIVADKDLRLWVTIDRQLKILDEKQQWITPKWPDPKSKPVRTQGNRFWSGIGPSLIVPMGGGVTMYVADRHLGDGDDKAYIMFLENGAIKSAEVPAPTQGLWRAPGGALWVVAKRIPEGKKYHSPDDKIVLTHIDPNGETKEFILPAPPIFQDKSGILWLAEADDNNVNGGSFWLWKDGQIVGQAQVPGVWTGKGIVSDKEGSVWIWNNLGLHHLVAEDARNPTRYRVKSATVVEVPTDPRGQYFGAELGLCDQGLMLKSCYNPSHGITRYYVQFLPLPRP